MRRAAAHIHNFYPDGSHALIDTAVSNSHADRFSLAPFPMNTLHEAINSLTVNSIKEMLPYLPQAVSVGRKEVLVASIVEQMSGAGLLRVWEQMDALQRLAIGEATHDAHGVLDSARFAAKYGTAPAFYHPAGKGLYYRQGRMTILGLFVFRVDRHDVIPADLRARLAAFVPAPIPDTLATLATLPEPDAETAPMTVRSTASDALHDLVVLLRAVDSGVIAVSDKTHLPGSAALRLVTGKLAGGDFYDITVPSHAWEQQVGPIKALAWPLLLQAGALAQLNGSKLGLTPAGMKALHAAPADVVRAIWRKWLKSTLLDEFGRIDDIKGQKAKGRGMSAVAPRRAVISDALQHCPVDRWVSVDELSRFMQAGGYPLEICHDVGRLYIGEPNYGSLIYGGAQLWSLLQLRYLLCVLFEYCATLGMIDVAYRSPHEARLDFGDLWGTGEMTFLSRYDGLMYFRLTALGAYCLGVSSDYAHVAAVAPAASCVLAVQANLQVRISAGALSADEALMLDNWAMQEDELHWRLDRPKAIAAIERGHDAAQLAAFLQARDSQPLPVQVESFVRSCNKQGKAMKVLGSSLLIECVDASTADLIAAHKDTAALCMRAGARHLVVRLDQENKFRKAVRLLGYGIPV